VIAPGPASKGAIVPKEVENDVRVVAKLNNSLCHEDPQIANEDHVRRFKIKQEAPQAY